MHGILIIDKPEGWTSHDVVARARRILKERRIGHTGTLDPFATGVLVLLVGRATRLAQFLSNAVKEYEALIRLGFATETGDLTGAPLQKPSAFDCMNFDAEKIEAALASLRGETRQVPPMFSAKKIEGKKLYELARRGETVERKAVRVTIEQFEVVPQKDGLLLQHNDDGTCDLEARVVCSAGTYVRVLAESFGERLGARAHLAALRRTRAGEFGIDRAVTLDELQTKTETGNLNEIFVSMNTALSHMVAVHLSDAEAKRVRNGAAIRAGSASESVVEDGPVRLLDASGELIGIGVYDSAQGLLRPRVMLAVDEK